MTCAHRVLLFLFHFAFASVPVIVRAQGETLGSFMCDFVLILNIVIAVLMALAFAVFIGGLAKFVFQADQEEAWDRAKFLMTWGILALFVMASVWAILQFLFNQFGFAVEFGNFLLPTGSNPVSPCA